MPQQSKIWVFGGRARPDASDHPAWAMFDKAVLIELQDGVETRRLDYDGTDLERELGVSRCFKAASVHGDIILACTNTEVLRICATTLTITARWTHPLFNDLHHVAMIGDRIYVVSTGIDSVLEFDLDMQFVRRFGVVQDEVIARYGEQSDFRQIPSTKPHEAHPNFIAPWAGGVWATRFVQRDVINIATRESFPLAQTPVHDGVPAFGGIWFTTVKGSVIRLDPETGTCQTIDLVKFYPIARPLGWCRGILPLSEHKVIVGFSKLRPTKQSENVSWVQSVVAGSKSLIKLPTRIALFDLQNTRVLWTIDLAQHGLDAVFSINVPDQ